MPRKTRGTSLDTLIDFYTTAATKNHATAILYN
jgi:hypothetical protein